MCDFCDRQEDKTQHEVAPTLKRRYVREHKVINGEVAGLDVGDCDFMEGEWVRVIVETLQP